MPGYKVALYPSHCISGIPRRLICKVIILSANWWCNFQTCKTRLGWGAFSFFPLQRRKPCRQVLCGYISFKLNIDLSWMSFLANSSQQTSHNTLPRHNILQGYSYLHSAYHNTLKRSSIKVYGIRQGGDSLNRNYECGIFTFNLLSPSRQNYFSMADAFVMLESIYPQDVAWLLMFFSQGSFITGLNILSFYSRFNIPATWGLAPVCFSSEVVLYI